MNIHVSRRFDMSRIEPVINELEEYISSCKAIPLSSKIAVNKDEIEDLIRELRLKTPDEIKKYQKLISNKDAILADAKEQAEQMIKAAQIHTDELVNEHEIMQRAYEQANSYIEDARTQAQQILDKAVTDANNIRMGAIRYTDEMLANLQVLIEHSQEDIRVKYESLMGAFAKNLNIVVSNRKELRPEEASPVTEEQLAEEVNDMMNSED